MKSDRNLRSSFKQLDAPGTPDLEYAATLRSQFVREARVDATSSIAAVASPQRKPAPLPKRRRWFDLAAAAVLLLSIIGGIARVSTTGDPTPTIQAPLTEQPAVMGGGTAAQDDQYSGPEPVSGWYEADSTIRARADGYHGPAQVFGNTLFLQTSTQSEPFETTLEGIDLTSGKVHWSRPVALHGVMAVWPLESC